MKKRERNQDEVQGIVYKHRKQSIQERMLSGVVCVCD